MLQDLKFAFRMLIRTPTFTLAAVLTLALGIGANAAIFSVVYAVLLKPLPYERPEQLIYVHDSYPAVASASVSWAKYLALRDGNRTLEKLGAMAPSALTLTGRGEPQQLSVYRVSGDFFDVLKTRPLFGRTIVRSDDDENAEPVIVLSHGVWQRVFGGNPNVVGQTIRTDGRSRLVIGIMPAEGVFSARTDAWIPLAVQASAPQGNFLRLIGRLNEGVTLERATADLAAVNASFNKTNGLFRYIRTYYFHDFLSQSNRRILLVLQGAVLAVLLVACANVANMLLARSVARRRELSIRAAIGASGGRLVRQLLTESVLLSLFGGGLGLLLAVWGVDMLIGLQPQGVPRLDNVRIDATVALFTFALAIGTGVLFGLVPALQTTRGSLSGSLKEAGRGALTSRSGSRVRSALVVSEIALAVTLLAGAGLLIRSFTRLASVDPGFRVEQALTFELTLPDARYEKELQQVAYFDQLIPKLRAIPGVQAAAAVVSLPLSGSSIVLTFEIAGRPPLPPSQQPAMQVRVATPDYFQTVGIPLKRGRAFTEQDREGAPPVVLITESTAKQYFPNEDPIGKKITLGWGRGPGTPRAGGEVVGIIGDVKDAGLDEADPPQIYLPYRQWPLQSMAVVLETSVPPERVADAARRETYSVDPNIPVGNVRTLQQVVERSISQPRFYMTLLTIFAALALLLAAVGTFGVLSYAVAQRSREIGIRMALGAQERTVVGLIVRHAMILAAGGIALGVTAAWFLSKLLSAFLFATDPRDLATLAAVALTLGLVALLASYLPARRATKIDPVVALRAE
jgi:putative ABC transport system permease protein